MFDELLDSTKKTMIVIVVLATLGAVILYLT